MKPLPSTLDVWMQRAGVLLLALLPLHVWLRPEGGWALLAACDICYIACALGLLFRSHRLVGAAFLFSLTVSLPAMTMGLATGTYPWNWSGIAIHIVPATFGGVRVYREGLPRTAAFDAWFVYAAAVMVASVVSPPELNINFGARPWTPVAGTFSLRVFQTLLIMTVGALLWLGQLVGWLISRRRAASSRPAPAR
ncbi:MAG TPA: hypothetical protein VMZ53_13270 [Kofleriaceae bacterium]|nr:hypothetical protein [Kofleriaceae bacterium]